MHFVGTPCRKCSGTLRYVRSRACVACGRAHAKAQRSGENYKAFREYQNERSRRLGPRPRTEKVRAQEKARYHRLAAIRAAEKSAAKAAYEAANAEQIASAEAAKRAAAIQRKREYMRRWRRDNPIKQAAQSRTKKARRRNAPGRHTAADVLAIGDRQNWRCAWCATDCRKAYHVDHIIPLAKGGSNWPDNLCIACPPCNMSKKDKPPHEFAQTMGKLL